MFFSIKRVKLSNFRSFVGSHDSGELPTKGLVLINGSNLDTGGSSGSGKSNFTLAIAYALGYSHIPATKLQCRKTDDPMQVEVVVETEAGEVTVKRGATTSITGPGFDLKGATAVNEKIESLLGFNMGMLKSLTYRPQRKFDFFLSLDDAQKRDFLTALLGLEKLEAVGLKYKEEVIRLSERSEMLRGTYLGLSVAMEHAGKYDIKPTIDPEVQKSTLETRNAKLHLAQADYLRFKFELEELVKQLRVDQSALETRRKESLDIIASYVKDRRAEIKEEREAKLAEFNNNSSKNLARRSELADSIKEFKAERAKKERELAAELAEMSRALSLAQGYWIKHKEREKARHNKELECIKASSQICPSCEQPTKDNKLSDKLQAELAQLVVERDQFITMAAVQESRLVGKRVLEAEHALLKGQTSTPFDEEYVLADKAYAEEVSTFYAFSSKIQEESALQEQQISKDELYLKNFALSGLEDRIFKLQNLIGVYRNLDVTIAHGLDSIVREKSAIAKELTIISELQEQAKKRELHRQKTQLELSDLKLEIASVGQQLALAKEVSTIFSREGFYGLIFEEVVDCMVEYINANAMYFPNIGSYTFGFDMQKVTQKGDSKNRITPFVFDGEKLPLLESISGGQLTSFELLTDFAFYDTVYSRTKKMPGYLILDESFNGHDNKVKEACLDFLKKNSESRAIFIIDHASEFKEMFDKHIKVVSQNGVSRLE